MRTRRHTPPDTGVRPPARSADTPGSVAEREAQRLADLALLRAVVDHLEEFKPKGHEEDKWASEQEAFASMLERLADGKQVVLTSVQRAWVLDVAERREVEWELPERLAADVPARRVRHVKFGLGSVVREGEAGKLVVDFDFAEVGRKVLLASFLTDA